MDTLQLLDPIIVLSKLFGLTPVVQQFCESSNSKEYRFSKFWFVYAVTFISVQTVAEITVMEQAELKSQKAVLFKVFGFLTHGSFIFLLSTEIMSLYHAKKLAYSLNKLSSLLKGKGGSFPCRMFSYFLFCYLVLITMFLLTLMETFSIFKSNNLLLSSLSAARFPFSILPYFQVIHILIILQYKFQTLNSIVSSINHYSVSICNKSTQTKIYQANKPDKKGLVKNVSYLHHSLCDLADGFNSIYSVQVTVLLGMVFVETTVCLYVTTLPVAVSGSSSMLAMHAGILLFFIKITSLLWLCNQTSRQVNN